MNNPSGLETGINQLSVDVTASSLVPLRARIRSAYAWTVTLQVTRNLASFGLSLLLARALEPRDYGLVGMVTVITGVLVAIQDSMAQAVVYLEDKLDDLPTYFTVIATLGICLSTSAFFSADLVAHFYREPRLVTIMHVVSLTVLLGSVRSVSQGLLTKRFHFRSLTLVESGCLLASGTVAVVLAWRGFGVWSLVANVLLQALSATVMVSLLVRPRFTIRPNLAVIKKLLRWGLPMAGATLLWQFYENADYFVIGRMLGTVALGRYAMAFRLATMPNDKISAIINRVSFPSFVAIQDHADEVSQHWFSLTKHLAWLNIPVLTILAMSANDFIAVALGPKWLLAAPLIKFLCVVGILKSFVSVTVNMVCARGRTDLNFKFTLLNSLLLPVGFVLGSKLASVEGVGLAWCLIFPLTAAYLIRQAARILGVTVHDYASILVRPATSGLLAAAVMLATEWLPGDSLSRFALRSSAALVCCGVFFLCQPEGAGLLSKCRLRPVSPRSGGKVNL